MTTQNWPDPKRPGVPMFPERDGWHVLERIEEDGFDIAIWKNGKWFDSEDNTPVARKYMVRDYRYHGPVLTPTQINEMLAAEREQAAKEAEKHRSNVNPHAVSGWDVVQTSTANNIAKAIRNLGAAP